MASDLLIQDIGRTYTVSETAHVTFEITDVWRKTSDGDFRYRAKVVHIADINLPNLLKYVKTAQPGLHARKFFGEIQHCGKRYHVYQSIDSLNIFLWSQEETIQININNIVKEAIEQTNG